ASTAKIYIAASNQYTLFVNGQQIGSGNNFQLGGAFCVQAPTLAPGCNDFAVSVVNNLVPDPGLLVHVDMIYQNGQTGTFVTDNTWRSFTSVPSGFELPGFDISKWPGVFGAGASSVYGSAPWGAILIPQPTVPTFSLADATWIWTNEVSGGSAPVGLRAFRKTISLGNGVVASSISVTIAADNEYTLWVQGQQIGSGTDFNVGQTYNLNPIPTGPELLPSAIVIAVEATNQGGPAGLIAVVNVFLSNGCGSVISVVTDGTWKSSTTVPNDFQIPNFGDSNWPNAIIEGQYGVGPWGNIAA
ncbi:hypothetical protein GALMADRAFT_27135, partial [Galerina marginata CBS 339.88]